MENKPKTLHKWFGLYEKVAKNGSTYYKGQSGGLSIKVFRNARKQEDKDPDLIVYLDTEQREFQNKGYVPRHPQGQEFVKQEYFPRGQSQTRGAPNSQQQQGPMPEIRSGSRFEQFQQAQQKTQASQAKAQIKNFAPVPQQEPEQEAYFAEDPGPEEVPF